MDSQGQRVITTIWRLQGNCGSQEDTPKHVLSETGDSNLFHSCMNFLIPLPNYEDSPQSQTSTQMWFDDVNVGITTATEPLWFKTSLDRHKITNLVFWTHIHTHTCTLTHTNNPQICTYRHIHAYNCMHAHIHTCMYTKQNTTHTNAQIHMHSCKHRIICVYMHTDMYNPSHTRTVSDWSR